MSSIFQHIVFYFLILVVKYKFYPSIVIDYFNGFQIISEFSLRIKFIIFSTVLGVIHCILNKLILERIVTKSSQIIYLTALTTPALFYGLKFFNISRILLGLMIVILILIDIFIRPKKIVYAFVLFGFVLISVIQLNAISDTESNDLSAAIKPTTTTTIRTTPANYLTPDYINKCINTFSTLDESSFSQSKLLNKFYVVGHAYGAHDSTNQGMQDSLLNYFETLDTNKATLLLTGDIVKESSFENLNLVKNQIESFFDEYYISIGNHDIGHGKSSDFYKVFEEDLNMINYDNFSLIIANFSTYNWQPSLKDQVKINNFINKSPNKNIIILSHPVFWYNLTLNKPWRNGDDMLKVELGLNTLDWLEQGDKNITIISGDYGSNVPETFCEYDSQKNILYIASGIYDQIDDRIIIIVEASDGYYVEEKILNN